LSSASVYTDITTICIVVEPDISTSTQQLSSCWEGPQ